MVLFSHCAPAPSYWFPYTTLMTNRRGSCPSAKANRLLKARSSQWHCDVNNFFKIQSKKHLSAPMGRWLLGEPICTVCWQHLSLAAVIKGCPWNTDCTAGSCIWLPLKKICIHRNWKSTGSEWEYLASNNKKSVLTRTEDSQIQIILQFIPCLGKLLALLIRNYYLKLKYNNKISPFLFSLSNPSYV